MNPNVTFLILFNWLPEAHIYWFGLNMQWICMGCSFCKKQLITMSGSPTSSYQTCIAAIVSTNYSF